jgi:hypothetical protein
VIAAAVVLRGSLQTHGLRRGGVKVLHVRAGALGGYSVQPGARQPNARPWLTLGTVHSGTKSGVRVRYAVRDPLVGDLLDVARGIFNNHLVDTQDLLETLKREQRAR